MEAICVFCHQPRSLELAEKPDFVIGDRVRLKKNGRKGRLMKAIVMQERPSPGSLGWVTTHICWFTVKFEDERQPRTKRYTPSELEKLTSKAVKIDEPANPRTTA